MIEGLHVHACIDETMSYGYMDGDEIVVELLRWKQEIISVCECVLCF
jgi:hypothetical protein